MSALDDLRFLEKRFRGILELIPQLEDVSSLDSQIKEFTVSVEKLKFDYASAKEDLIKAKDAVSYSASEAKTIVQNAVDQSEAIIDNAKDEAKAITNAAKDEASDLVAVANAQVQNILSEKTSKEKSLAALDVSIKEKQDIYNDLTSKLAALKSKL